MRGKQTVCYFVNINNVLMRKWRPPNIMASYAWSVVCQIMVLPLYRRDISHDTPLAGHLGIEKMYHKVLGHFYWPGLHGDVKKFCETCMYVNLQGNPINIHLCLLSQLWRSPLVVLLWIVWGHYPRHILDINTSLTIICGFRKPSLSVI